MAISSSGRVALTSRSVPWEKSYKWSGKHQSIAFGKSVKILLGPKEREAQFLWLVSSWGFCQISIGQMIKRLYRFPAKSWRGSRPVRRWWSGVRDGESSLSVIGSRCSTSAEIKVKIYFLLATNGSQAMRISILIANISLSVYHPYFLSYFQLVACVLA